MMVSSSGPDVIATLTRNLSAELWLRRDAGLTSCHDRIVDNDAISDLFAGLGPVSIRRLFGGKGIYFDGVIIAIELRGELMLKGDAELGREFDAAGCTQWTYVGSRHGKQVAMPYWTLPDGAADDADEMTIWARKSYEAGLRSGK